jgi:hypothetical protein
LKYCVNSNKSTISKATIARLLLSPDIIWMSKNTFFLGNSYFENISRCISENGHIYVYVSVVYYAETDATLRDQLLILPASLVPLPTRMIPSLRIQQLSSLLVCNASNALPIPCSWINFDIK